MPVRSTADDSGCGQPCVLTSHLAIVVSCKVSDPCAAAGPVIKGSDTAVDGCAKVDREPRSALLIFDILLGVGPPVRILKISSGDRELSLSRFPLISLSEGPGRARPEQVISSPHTHVSP
ncbi:hypothetical protein F2P79_005299 [Pimephales promelas]|nr:hypothetical protein F2P79_005299 [Pimephales promelas]